MQKCSYCEADLVENAHFCGKCGSVQDTLATDGATNRSNYPMREPAWSSNTHVSVTPSLVAEDEDEDRRGVAPWPSLYDVALGGDALLSSGQAYTPGTPVVQGTPQIGTAPSVAGPYTNAPVGQSGQTPANAAPVSHPVQEPVKVPVKHPIHGPGKAPVKHPIHGPGKAPVKHPVKVPVSHPVKEPQPIHHPPEKPGTQKHHKTHEHHNHLVQREPHAATRKFKMARGSALKTIVIVVATVVVAAGAIGAATHFFVHPQPLISISSKYTVGNALAGAPGTSLHISGQKFSGNSAITFLLDGRVAPGNAGTRSDSNGNVSADVTITDAWSMGTHTLTAKDASNDSTQNGISVTIVQPGQANTPGPNGAPPDDATFTLNIAPNGRNNTVNQSFTNNQEALHITGHPDPMGGTACLDSDNGQQFNSSYVATGAVPFTETYSFSCKGSYKSGKISYTETLLTDVVTFTDGSGISCTLTSPQLNQQLTGSYTGNGSFAGTWTYGPISQSDFSCSDPNQTFYYTTNQGNWTGTVSGLQ